MATGVNSGSLSRGSGLSAESGSNVYNSSDWGLSFDANDYYEVAISLAANAQITAFSNITFIGTSSSSGPTTLSIRSSQDGYASDIGATQTTAASETIHTFNISSLAPVGLGGSVTLRIYGYGATSPAGTFKIGDAAGTSVDVTLAATVALPMELTSFSAIRMSNSNKILWQTATETGVSHFEIQRSLNAENWQTIGEVKAAGESREILDYSFTDEKPLPISYYRLRSVDFDGAEQFSGIERVERVGETKAPYVLPTNVENETTVVFESELERESKIVIFDMTGRMMFTQKVSIQKGENSMSLELGNLPKGAYALRIDGEKASPSRFMKI